MDKKLELIPWTDHKKLRKLTARYTDDLKRFKTIWTILVQDRQKWKLRRETCVYW